ncbi:alcohol dehydrogenase catalytic domain-containing protein [Streptomyces sp. NPDC002870]|uniref:MmyB family transcriptional regulator n=1 Tax=Streptomyces sp. NPDC002870 TaxID=3364666 RepID=UPI00367EB79D
MLGEPPFTIGWDIAGTVETAGPGVSAFAPGDQVLGMLALPGAGNTMVALLRRASPEFTELWDTGDVALRRGDRKRINHPKLGVFDVHCQSLFSEDGRQRLQFFTAPAGSPAHEQLRLLAVIGIQELADGPTDSVVNPMP